MHGWVAGPACILLFFLVQLVSSRWAGASLVLRCCRSNQPADPRSSHHAVPLEADPSPLCSDCPPRRVLAMCYAVDGQEFARFHHAVRYILGRRDGLLLGACQMVNRE